MTCGPCLVNVQVFRHDHEMEWRRWVFDRRDKVDAQRHSSREECESNVLALPRFEMKVAVAHLSSLIFHPYELHLLQSVDVVGLYT